MRERNGVWGGCKELLAAAELWNLRNVVVRPGHGERIVWLKLESRHDEFLASDNSEEFTSARRAHIKKLPEICQVAFSKLDCVKDDRVKDLDGGALSKWSGAASRREHEWPMVPSFRRLQKVANVVASDQSVGITPCLVVVAQTNAKTLRNRFLQTWFPCW